MSLLALICGRLSKFIGNLSKVFTNYLFHPFLPKKNWQTNYANQVSLPVYLNHLFNRLMSLSIIDKSSEKWTHKKPSEILK